jgi:hypothetical protein
MTSSAQCPDAPPPGLPARSRWALVLAVGLVLSGATGARAQLEQDQIDLTGRQNLTLGSGARAYGMGGAFLARPDDATAASWNPAGLSYLRLPEVSLVGAHNSYVVEQRTVERDSFAGSAFDFAAFTWPVAVKDVRGAVQLSYQRAISFDGTRTISQERGPTQGRSNGGFDVVAVGTGLRLSRRLRVGVTVNRWLNGYEQELNLEVPTQPNSERVFDLDFRPRGWSVNVGAIWSPVESLNVGAVFKTPFTADVRLKKQREDTWTDEGPPQVTFNQHESKDVTLDFPASYGFGLSWRPLDIVTVSADLTRTRWSRAFIYDYFDLSATPVGGEPPPANVFDVLPYPSLGEDRVVKQDVEQVDAEQIRVGVEYVLLTRRFKIPFRAGYFNDRQIVAYPGQSAPRFNGITVGTGIILGSLLLDVAYLHEFGKYSITLEQATASSTPVEPITSTVHTNRFFASVIYRFTGRP